MLILKSFDITDDKGMNELLKTTRLAPGSSVFVSNGKILVPIEDGLPINREQKLIKAKEERNIMALTADPINHSQRVLDVQITEVTKQIDSLTSQLAEFKKGKGDANEKARLEKKLQNLKNVLAQFENQHTTNKAELDRVKVNLDIYDQTISDLEEFTD